MLIVSNGAVKSGSTWLFKILKYISSAKSVQDKYQHPTRKRSSILYKDLKNLVNDGKYHNEDIIIKNHFGSIEIRDFLLSEEKIKVFDISRNIKDVTVSAYYYLKEKYSVYNDLSFDKFYWSKGRLIANKVRNHHSVWNSADGVNYYCSSYSKLSTDFESEIKRIASVLNIGIGKEEIVDIKEKTSIDYLKENDNKESIDSGKFFRKGGVGGWKNHFDTKKIRDIKKIESRGIRIGQFISAKLRVRLLNILN